MEQMHLSKVNLLSNTTPRILKESHGFKEVYITNEKISVRRKNSLISTNNHTLNLVWVQPHAPQNTPQIT